MLYPSILEFVLKRSRISKAVSIVYCNIRELQSDDGIKRKAETFSCHYHSNI